MKVTLWGTRGSLPAPGPETTRYGGNTPCVEVRAADGTVLILDAGSGIRQRLGDALANSLAATGDKGASPFDRLEHRGAPFIFHCAEDCRVASA